MEILKKIFASKNNKVSEETDEVSKVFVRQISPNNPSAEIIVKQNDVESFIYFPQFNIMTEPDKKQLLTVFANVSPFLIKRVSTDLSVNQRVNEETLGFHLTNIRNVLSRDFQHSEIQLSFMFNTLNYSYVYPDELIDWVIEHEEELYIEFLELTNNDDSDSILKNLYSRFLSPNVDSAPRQFERAIERASVNHFVIYNHLLTWLFNDDLSITFGEVISKPLNLDKITGEITVVKNLFQLTSLLHDQFIDFKKDVLDVDNNDNEPNPVFDFSDTSFHAHFSFLMNLTAFEMLSVLNFPNNHLGHLLLDFPYLFELEEKINKGELNDNHVKRNVENQNSDSLFIEYLVQRAYDEIQKEGEVLTNPWNYLSWAVFFSYPGSELFGRGLLKPVVKKLEESGQMNDLKKHGTAFYSFDIGLFNAIVEWEKEYDNGSDVPVNMFHNLYNVDVDEHVEKWNHWADGILDDRQNNSISSL